MRPEADAPLREPFLSTVRKIEADLGQNSNPGATQLGLWRENSTVSIAEFSKGSGIIRVNRAVLLRIATCVTFADAGGSDSHGPVASAVVAFLLAHEYGHYLDWRSLRQLSRSPVFTREFRRRMASDDRSSSNRENRWQEAWADYFGGYVLRRLRPDGWFWGPVETSCATNMISLLPQTSEYPTADMRIELIKQGTKDIDHVRSIIQGAMSVTGRP